MFLFDEYITYRVKGLNYSLVVMFMSLGQQFFCFCFIKKRWITNIETRHLQLFKQRCPEKPNHVKRSFLQLI